MKTFAGGAALEVLDHTIFNKLSGIVLVITGVDGAVRGSIYKNEKKQKNTCTNISSSPIPLPHSLDQFSQRCDHLTPRFQWYVTCWFWFIYLCLFAWIQRESPSGEDNHYNYWTRFTDWSSAFHTLVAPQNKCDPNNISFHLFFGHILDTVTVVLV